MNKVISTIAMCLVLVAPAFAGTLSYGGYLGTFSGNDSSATVAAALGIDESAVNFLANVDWPDTTNDGLSISDLTLNGDGEATSGEWAFAGVVDLIVIKAGS
ncbi:MAG: hypothetical protein KJO55_03560, partial [Gammaproteobacteria bacterium]|nr:hypothetical protein [Gammaproteobacteria bacterium]